MSSHIPFGTTRLDELIAKVAPTPRGHAWDCRNCEAYGYAVECGTEHAVDHNHSVEFHDNLVVDADGNSSWDECTKFEHGRFRKTHTLWMRIADGERIFTALRNGVTPRPDDGGYKSIDAALRQKGMF